MNAMSVNNLIRATIMGVAKAICGSRDTSLEILVACGEVARFIEFLERFSVVG